MRFTVSRDTTNRAASLLSTPSDEPTNNAAAGWPRGTSPRGSHRSVRDALTSYGSCYPNIAATSDANGTTR